MIWHLACLAPQTILINDLGASRSKINSIVNTCREAREVASGLQLDYYRVSECLVEEGADRKPGKVKNYVNLHVDTIWYTGNPTLLGLVSRK